jgi:hypothetical protein
MTPEFTKAFWDRVELVVPEIMGKKFVVKHEGYLGDGAAKLSFQILDDRGVVLASIGGALLQPGDTVAIANLDQAFNVYLGVPNE